MQYVEIAADTSARLGKTGFLYWTRSDGSSFSSSALFAQKLFFAHENMGFDSTDQLDGTLASPWLVTGGRAVVVAVVVVVGDAAPLLLNGEPTTTDVLPHLFTDVCLDTLRTSLTGTYSHSVVDTDLAW